MNQLVFIEKGQVVTDSLTVAEVFGKRHDVVLRDIRTQMEYAGEEFGAHNFVETSYLNSQNKSLPKFSLTEEAFTLIVFSYNTKEAVQTKIKFIQEFKRMREELSKPRALTEREQRIEMLKLSLETAEEVAVIKNEVAEIKDTLKNRITIDHAKQCVLLNQIHIRVAKLWESDEFKQNYSKRKLYARIHTNLHRAFMITSYKDVKDSEFEEAVSWVRVWRPLI